MALLLQLPLLQQLRHDVGVNLLHHMHLQQTNVLLCQLAEEGPEVYVLLPAEPLLDVLMLLVVSVGLEDAQDQVHNVVNVELQIGSWEWGVGGGGRG